MTIKNAGKKKKNLERKISKLIKTFESSTGLKVGYVEQLIKDKIQVSVMLKSAK